MQARRLIVPILLIALGAAACGSSSKSASGGTTTSVPATPGAQASTPATGTPTTKKLSGSSNSTFCGFARQVTKSSADFATLDPTDLKTEFSNIEKALEQAVAIAPSAIKPDMKTLQTAYKTWETGLAAADYNFVKAAPAAEASLGTPKVKTASQNIEAYVTQVCKVTTTT